MAIERHAITSREQWLELRLKDITASDVPTVCGVGLYGSAAELYAGKKGQRPPIAETAAMQRGRWDEPSVFEALAEKRPEWEVRRAKIYLRDPDLRLGCTPDGFALAPDADGLGVVQAKSISRSVFRERWLVDPNDDIELGDAEVPEAYRLQTLTEEMLSDSKWGILAVVIKSEFASWFRLFDVDRDAETEALIRDKVAAFWRDYLDANIMPPFELPRDAELIKRLYPKDDGTLLDLATDNRALALVEDLTEARAAQKRSKDLIEKLQAELGAKIGEHTFAALGDGRCIRYKREPRRSYVVPASSPRVMRILKAVPKLQEIEDDE